MNEMLIFALFFVACIALAWGVLVIVWLVKFGRTKETVRVYNIPIRVRSNKLPLPVKIAEAVPEGFVDKEIWEDCEIVCAQDLTWGKQRLAGMSKDYFSYLRFKTIHVLSINLSYAEEKKFNSTTLSRLIVHEYLHRFFDKHTESSDPYHVDRVWRDL